MTTAQQRSAPQQAPPVAPAGVGRWWVYQRERFPLAAHGPLIAAFSFCAVSFSHMLRQAPGLPAWPGVLVAFITCLIFFIQLRIADEFKDYADDLRWRPYRPVQRGLVRLRELGVLFALGCVIQLGLAVWLEVRLVAVLLIAWLYLAGMCREFGLGERLKQRPLLYMVSHMMIMPLVDLYATACDWLAAGLLRPPLGLGWFLAASFFNGMVIEIGRKIRSPQDEEEGVSTYSAVWGIRRASAAWLGVLAAAAACATLAAMNIGAQWIVGGTLAVLWCIAAALVYWMNSQPLAGRGRRVEQWSGVWTLALYLSLGLVPLILGTWR